MSAMRGRRSGRARGRPVRFSDPIDDSTVDPPIPTAPPATSGPSISVDPVAPSGQTAPVDPPSLGVGMTTPVRGRPAPGPEPAPGVIDETMNRQFLQLIQGVVRAAGVTSEVPISQTLISNGISTFSGSLTAAPTEAESWLYDTERRMDQLGFDSARRYLGVVSMLNGNARTWWDSIVSSVPPERLTWDFFKERFKNRYLGERFLKERRQAFKDLVQGSMTVAEYEIQFLDLLRYGTGLVSTEKDRCEKFLEGLRIGIRDRVATHHDEVFEDLVNRAKTAEELEILTASQSSRDRDRFRGRDRDRSERSHSQGDSYVRPEKRIRTATYQRGGSSYIPIAPQGSVASRGDSSGFSPIPLCEQCGKLHRGECKKMKGVCFRCGSPGHFQRDCTRTSLPGRASTQTPVRSQTPARSQASVQTPDTEHYQSRAQGSVARSGSRGRFQQSDRPVMSDARQPALVYATRRRDDRDGPNVIAGTFTIYSVPYFALLDNGSTHSYISRTVSQNLPIPSETTENALTVMSPVGQSVLVNKVFRRCPLMVQDEIFLADLMELPLEEFDLILGMDWLAEHRVNLDCESKIATLKTSEGQTVVLIGERRGYLTNVISTLTADRMIKKGYQTLIATIWNTKGSLSRIEEIPVVEEFPDVFPEELPGLPPDRDVEFEIETYPGSAPISMAPYRMAPKEYKELKVQLQELLDQGFIRPSTSPWGAPNLSTRVTPESSSAHPSSSRSAPLRDPIATRMTLNLMLFTFQLIHILFLHQCIVGSSTAADRDVDTQ
ncbi:hypothetical protein GQ457_02G020130 [Hibiscus cannabinus]